MPVLEVQAYADADMPASVGGAQRLARELLALREWARKALPVVDEMQSLIDGEWNPSDSDEWPVLADEVRALLPETPPS